MGSKHVGRRPKLYPFPGIRGTGWDNMGLRLNGSNSSIQCDTLPHCNDDLACWLEGFQAAVAGLIKNLA